jgi:hypothetical protein
MNRFQIDNKLNKAFLFALIIISAAVNADVLGGVNSDSEGRTTDTQAFVKRGNKYWYRAQNGHMYWTRHPDENRYRTIPHKLKIGEFYSPDDIYPARTHANINCPDGSCRGNRNGSRRRQYANNRISEDPANYEPAGATALTAKPAAGSLLDRFAHKAWAAATAGRRIAAMCGGGYRRGNRSKCMCASGVQEALLKSGVCAARPGGDAIAMKSSINSHSCPNLHRINSRNPYSARAGSVIVYSTTRHRKGHVESVIPAPIEAAIAMHVPVGTKLYCSDFCRTAPFLAGGTNHVAQIFSL